MMFEFALALFTNLQKAAIALLIIFGIATAVGCISSVIYFCETEPEPAVFWKTIRSYARVHFMVGALLIAVVTLPSVNDLWKVRIGLIKLQLASPENVGKGVDTIERIGRKLECKYLGCKDDKEAK